MDFPEENAVIVGGPIKKDDGRFDLPLAAILCIVIVIYGLLVLICIFLRQVILKRRPLNELESLHCCDCLLLMPRPEIKICNIPCGQQRKTESLPCKFNFEWLWTVLPPVCCSLPKPPPGPPCWPPVLPAVQCPSSVRCCGLEIRRDTRPGMVDASVSSGDVLKSAALVSPAASSRGVQRGAVLQPADSHHYSQQSVDSIHYSHFLADSHHFSQHPADSRHYSQHPADLGDHSQHPADLGDYSQRTADSTDYSQHSITLNPAALPQTDFTSALRNAT